MLPAGHRLRRGADISTVVRRGRRAVNPGPRLLVLHLRAAEPVADSGDPSAAVDRLPRAGFVVGKSVGGSVTRKRVIRRLRHLVRPHLERLPAGTDLVVRALPGSAVATYDELGRALEIALRRATSTGRPS